MAKHGHDYPFNVCIEKTWLQQALLEVLWSCYCIVVARGS